MRWLDGITDAKDMNLGNFREIVRDREAWQAAVHGVPNSQTWLSDWTKISLLSDLFKYVLKVPKKTSILFQEKYW